MRAMHVMFFLSERAAALASRGRRPDIRALFRSRCENHAHARTHARARAPGNSIFPDHKSFVEFESGDSSLTRIEHSPVRDEIPRSLSSSIDEIDR